MAAANEPASRHDNFQQLKQALVGDTRDGIDVQYVLGYSRNIVRSSPLMRRTAAAAAAAAMECCRFSAVRHTTC